MPSSEENLSPDVATAEDIGFAADELVACSGCGRSNAPNKRNCLYCGAALPVTDVNADSGHSTFRRLEAWEPGFNLVFSSSVESAAVVNLEAAGRLLSIDPDELKLIADLNCLIPLLRVEDEQTAESGAKALAKLGFETRSISDRSLDAEHPPIRVRAIDINESEIIFSDFNSNKLHVVTINDVVLIATGRIYESRREEVTRRKRGAVKVLDEFETSGDVGVVDIYSKTDAVGFRIQTNGFDFSVLGDDKEMLAGKNLAKLGELLKSMCVNAIIANEYDDVRHHLDLVWEPDLKKDSHGLQMRGYGKREFGATYTSSNQMQFTKYSRMRRLMI